MGMKPVGREVLIKGYLRKAPPLQRESKYLGVYGLLCGGCRPPSDQRWKRRFCIFYKIRKPTETEVFFEYYKDETEKHPRGRVDLNSCDCIYEQKSFSKWPNVFVVTTNCRGKRRDYLFSASTPEDMNSWIVQLTTVLRMVPEQIPGKQFSDRIGRNGTTVSPFPQHRPIMSGAASSSASPINNLPWVSNASSVSHGYYGQGLTEEYRTSFGDPDDDDEDCYRMLPQPDHAYVNLKTSASFRDQSAPQKESASPQDQSTHNGSRPDSVYFNVWDSSTGNVCVEDARVVYRKSRLDLEPLELECVDVKEQKEPEADSPHQDDGQGGVSVPPPEEPAAPSQPSDFNECALPVRSRVRATSSSSSTNSDDDAEDVDNDDAKAVEGAGEAEAAPSDSGELTPPPSSFVADSKPGDAPTEVDSGSATGGPVIQYLDAKNLDFSQRHRRGKGAPAVPPKPAHLRKTPVNEASSVGSSADVGSSGEQIEYKELDPRGTQALFMVTKQVFGDTEAY
uniref:PH domain-containing protein n=2 Tax=Mesocestoides corti TaxID=53468 RepID=A0A5K3FUM7_MESCO